jgi:glycosyltransferase involved in cell wall biosynthesis
MKVSIIIPVYNESPTFREVLDRVIAAPLPAGCSKEVLVIDDGSTDGTAQIINEFKRAGLILSYRSRTNTGKATALRIGISLASGDAVLIQDGDLEYDPNDFGRILSPLIKGEADVVYGSRFHSKPFWRGPQGMRLRNLVANRFLTMTTNVLFGARISDMATAYKCFRTTILRRMRFDSRRFEFCPEVTAKLRRLGYGIAEVPISYYPRGIAEGKKIRARDGWVALWTLLKLRFASRERLLSTNVNPNEADEPIPHSS